MTTWNLVLPNGARLTAKEAINRWYSMDHIFVKIVYHDGRIGILRYDSMGDCWVPSLLPLDSLLSRAELVAQSEAAWSQRQQRNSLHRQSSEPYLRLIAAPDSRERNEGNAT